MEVALIIMSALLFVGIAAIARLIVENIDLRCEASELLNALEAKEREMAECRRACSLIAHPQEAGEKGEPAGEEV